MNEFFDFRNFSLNRNSKWKFRFFFQDQNRYHEDIFGITFRTAEVHNRSRETARIRLATEPSS